MTWVELAATSTSSSFKLHCLFSSCFEPCVLYLRYFRLIWNPRKLHHKIRRPGHVFWHAQWLKFQRNRLSEVESGLKGLTQFKVFQEGTVCWEGFWADILLSGQTMGWSEMDLIAKSNSADNEGMKNEEWRSGCFRAPIVLHVTWREGVWGRKHSVFTQVCSSAWQLCCNNIENRLLNEGDVVSYFKSSPFSIKFFFI